MCINIIFSSRHIPLISSVHSDEYGSNLHYSTELFIRYIGRYHVYKDWPLIIIFSAGNIPLISSVCTDAYSSNLQYSIDLFIRYLGQYNGYKD